MLARRDEIIAALALTAKPYFGDVGGDDVLRAAGAVPRACATGALRPLRRRRVGPSELARARARRCVGASRRGSTRRVGPIAVASARRPGRGAASVRVAYPAAATTLLHPADAQFFLEVCDRPGKPVPFVPVLDAEVRRWYMADGLWQAQDDRLDADEVFVIPGPEAVAGITRADEPVAELLARFEAEAIARVTAPPVARARLAAPGPAPAPLAALRGRSGPIAALLRRPVRRDRGRPHAPEPAVAARRPGRHDRPSTATRSPCRPPRRTVETRRRSQPTATTPCVTIDTGAGEPLVAALPRRCPADAARRRAEVGGDAARAAFAAARLGRRRAARRRRSAARRRRRRWTLPGRAPRAYRAATGAAHDGVPLDLALTLAWPALCGAARVRRSSRRGCPELVHASHAVTPGPAWPPLPGESGATRRRGWSSSHDPAGAPTRLRCHARVELAARHRRRRRGRARDPRRRARDRVRAAPPRPPRRRRSRSPRPATPTSSPRSRGCSCDAELAAGDVLHVRAETTVDVPRDGAAALDRDGHGRARRRDDRDDPRRDRRPATRRAPHAACRRDRAVAAVARPARAARPRAARAAAPCTLADGRGRRARLDGGVRARRRGSQPAAPVGARGADGGALAADRARRVDGGAGVGVRRRRAVRRRRRRCCATGG